MAIKPILFDTEMVKAILKGRKTQTRRVVKPQPTTSEDCKHKMTTFGEMLPEYYKNDYDAVCKICGYGVGYKGVSMFRPPYVPGDVLWVRERFCEPYELGRYAYYADYDENNGIIHPDGHATISASLLRWKPSIHMPKQAARIFLRVTDVRVERLQDIHEKYEPGPDNPVIKEGFAFLCDFIATWNITIKRADRAKYGWHANPWVWVIEVERCEKPDDWKY